MEEKNAKNRSSQLSDKPQDRQLKAGVGSLGTIPGASKKYGLDEIGVGRKNSNKTDPFNSGQQSSNGIPGKITSQLIGETERQLAYYESQVTELKTRLQELRQLEKDSLQDKETEE